MLSRRNAQIHSRTRGGERDAAHGVPAAKKSLTVDATRIHIVLGWGRRAKVHTLWQKDIDSKGCLCKQNLKQAIHNLFR